MMEQHCPDPDEAPINDTLWVRDWSPEESLHKEIEAVLMGKVILAICSIGILGNLLNLLILSTQSVRMAKSTKLDLLSLAMSDLWFCIVVLVYCVKDKSTFEHEQLSFGLLYDLYGAVAINVFVTSSAWLTATIAFGRYIKLCAPASSFRKIFDTDNLHKCWIAGIFCFSVILNMPRFWNHAVDSIERSDCKGHYFYFGTISMNEHGETFYLMVYFVLALLAPLVVLLYSTIYLIKALRKSSMLHAEASISRNMVTRTLTAIVVFYVLLVVPTDILGFVKNFILHKMAPGRSSHMDMVVAIFNTMQVLNFGFNFILYCIINVHFRQAVVNLVKRKCRDCIYLKHPNM